jgi:hypothetical protein
VTASLNTKNRARAEMFHNHGAAGIEAGLKL